MCEKKGNWNVIARIQTQSDGYCDYGDLHIQKENVDSLRTMSKGDEPRIAEGND